MAEILTLNSIVYGAAGFASGYALGWMLNKLMVLAFKLSLIVVTLFFTALVYLESIHVIAINEKSLDNLLNASYYSIQTAMDKYGVTNPVEYIITTLGLPMASGLALGMIAGFFKG